MWEPLHQCRVSDYCKVSLPKCCKKRLTSIDPKPCWATVYRTIRQSAGEPPPRGAAGTQRPSEKGTTKQPQTPSPEPAQPRPRALPWSSAKHTQTPSTRLRNTSTASPLKAEPRVYENATSTRSTSSTTFPAVVKHQQATANTKHRPQRILDREPSEGQAPPSSRENRAPNPAHP